MKILDLLILISAFVIIANCTRPHAGMYIYKNDVFATTNVTSTDLSHIRDKGTKHVVLLQRLDTVDAKATITERKAMCHDFGLICHHLDLTAIDKEAKSKAQFILPQLEGQRIVVVSEDPAASAFFISLYAARFHNSSENEIDEIFAGLQTPVDVKIKSVLLSQ